MKRYNMAIKQELFDELSRVANDQGVSVLEVMRRCFKLGLAIDQWQHQGARFYVTHPNEKPKEVLLF